MNTAQVKEFIRAPFTWPGGYPLYAITSDGGCLCAQCCRAEWRNVCDSVRNSYSDGWQVVAIEANYESDIQCDNCDADIPAAYIDDDERAAMRRADC